MRRLGVRMKVQQEVEDGGERSFDILFADGLVRVMAEAAGRAHEEHSRWHMRRQDHGIVPSAGEHGLCCKPGAARGLMGQVAQVLAAFIDFVLGHPEFAAPGRGNGDTENV